MNRNWAKRTLSGFEKFKISKKYPKRILESMPGKVFKIQPPYKVVQLTEKDSWSTHKLIVFVMEAIKY